MKPDLNRENFHFRVNCASCHENHEMLEKVREQLQQLFSNRPSWIVKEDSKAVDILGALAELQRWCDYAERQILGES